MKNFLKHIEIKNFKSLKSAELSDCKRINLLIGRPNVGKSNLLEATGLLGLSHIRYDSAKKLTDFIRLENESELFFDGDTSRKIRIETNIAKCMVTYSPNIEGHPFSPLHIEITTDSESAQVFIVNEQLKVKSLKKGNLSFVKKYSFNPNTKYKKGHSSFLIPPYGKNLLNVIPNKQRLKEELFDIFNEYGLTIVFDKASQSLRVMKKEERDNIFLLPYSSVADTLQRIIFFKTAIASNSDSVILLEEPEAHSFPPYIVHITQEIIQSQSNQFFISTHSPYVVNDFLENCREELSIFMADFKEGETIIKKLSREELDEAYQYGVDLFMNNERYL